MTDDEFKCPRCGEVTAARYAMSRVDNKTEICSRCGSNEAIEQTYGSGLKPMREWAFVTGDRGEW